MQHFGQALKSIIEDGELTKRAIAERAGMCPTRLSQIFKVDDPNLSSIEKIATGMGIRVSTLLARVEKLEG